MPGNRPSDSLGNPVTLQTPASLAALNDFVEGFIASEARAVNILQLADSDHSPIVQASIAICSGRFTWMR